jgi:hypothetical protein
MTDGADTLGNGDMRDSGGDETYPIGAKNHEWPGRLRFVCPEVFIQRFSRGSFPCVVHSSALHSSGLLPNPGVDIVVHLVHLAIDLAEHESLLMPEYYHGVDPRRPPCRNIACQHGNRH